MKVKAILVLLAILLAGGLFSGVAISGEAELRGDPVIKERFKHLASELRCLKCQNQTIWDSQAGLADDLKKQIRTQIYAGKTDDQIVEYMVDRYGDFVRFKPAVDKKNIFLWVAPFLFLIIGALLVVRYVRVRREQTEDDNDSISEEDRLRAQQILNEQTGSKSSSLGNVNKVGDK